MTDKETRGRKPIHDKPMKRVNVTLDEWTMEYLRGLRDGNLSEGIRTAALYSAAYQLGKQRENEEEME